MNKNILTDEEIQKVIEKGLNDVYKDYLLLYQILKKENKKVKLIYNKGIPKLVLTENKIKYHLIIDENNKISIINKKLQNKTFLIYLNYLYLYNLKKIKILINKPILC